MGTGQFTNDGRQPGAISASKMGRNICFDCFSTASAFAFVKYQMGHIQLDLGQLNMLMVIKGLDAVRIQGQSATVATFRKHILGFGWIKHLLFMALVTFLAATFSFTFFGFLFLFVKRTIG
jgi:hypothetical protein